jgi:energy-converting hydrogenase Eha subunit E
MKRQQILHAQGSYFLVTGLWPLIHMSSFEAVTGPKVDDWLVKMVGLLVVVIGGTLYLAAQRGNQTAEILGLAIGSALAFTSIDVWYALTGRISPIYLADAVLELGIVALLLTSKDERRATNDE